LQTVAYMGSDVVAGFPHTNHNDSLTFWTLYVAPSGFWIVVPFLSMVRLWGVITNAAAKSKSS
jgi:hypothetical protein